MTYQKFFFFKTKKKQQKTDIIRENCVKQCVCYIATFDCRLFFVYQEIKSGFQSNACYLFQRREQ